MTTPSFLLVVALGIFYIAVRDYSVFNEPIRLIYVGLAIVLLCGLLIFTIHRWADISADIKNRSLKVISGTPKLWSLIFRGIGYYGGSYAVTIANQTFLLPSQVRRLINEEKIYRFYVTPKVKIILSVEEVTST
jgi:hypothetical protein